MSEPSERTAGPRLLELRACGPRAVLAEYDSLDAVMAAAAHVRDAVDAGRLEGIVDVVPAARTVLVQHEGAVDRDVLVAALADVSPVVPDVSAPVEIAVRYDGADLADVAAACGLAVAEVVELHSGAEYTAAFCGFVPGFAYLIGLDPRLHLSRRATPRPRVPAGSVAIAAEHSAVYPSATPGGWHLVGTTDAVLWDETRAVPALVAPGARVRFVPT